MLSVAASRHASEPDVTACTLSVNARFSMARASVARSRALSRSKAHTVMTAIPAARAAGAAMRARHTPIGSSPRDLNISGRPQPHPAGARAYPTGQPGRDPVRQLMSAIAGWRQRKRLSDGSMTRPSFQQLQWVMTTLMRNGRDRSRRATVALRQHHFGIGKSGKSIVGDLH